MNELSTVKAPQAEIPFSTTMLDALMEKDGLDVLIITSRHNTRYFLGGYSSQFFSHTEAAGISRYLPVVVYVKGAPDKAIFIRTGSRRTSLPIPRCGFGNRKQGLGVPQTQSKRLLSI